jgi:hypothetical protein
MYEPKLWTKGNINYPDVDYSNLTNELHKTLQEKFDNLFFDQLKSVGIEKHDLKYFGGDIEILRKRDTNSIIGEVYHIFKNTEHPDNYLFSYHIKQSKTKIELINKTVEGSISTEYKFFNCLL